MHFTDRNVPDPRGVDNNSGLFSILTRHRSALWFLVHPWPDKLRNKPYRQKNSTAHSHGTRGRSTGNYSRKLKSAITTLWSLTGSGEV